MAQFDLKNCTVVIQDSGAAHSISLKVCEGVLSYTEKKNMRYIRDRGLLSTVVEGDQEPVDVKFDAIWEHLKQGSGETATVEDAVKQRGGASAWVSSDSDACAPYAVDIVITQASCGGAQTETITLSFFRYESIDHDAKNGTLVLSGKCNITQATVARS